MSHGAVKVDIVSLNALSWYFQRSVGNVLTVPLFGVLLALFLLSISDAVVYSLTLVQLALTAYGLLGVVVVASAVWLVLPFIFGPPVLSFLLLMYPAAILSDAVQSWPHRWGNLILGLSGMLVAIWLLHAAMGGAMSWLGGGAPCIAPAPLAPWLPLTQCR